MLVYQRVNIYKQDIVVHLKMGGQIKTWWQAIGLWGAGMPPFTTQHSHVVPENNWQLGLYPAIPSGLRPKDMSLIDVNWC